MKHSYSDGVCDKRIAILGIIPPPYGGVSVHIRRVVDKLIDQDNQVCFFNIEQRLRAKFFTLYLMRLFLWLLYIRPHAVHYHGTYNKNCMGDLLCIRLYMMVSRVKLVIIDHDSRHMYARGRLFIWLYSKIVTKAHVVCIGNVTEKSYQDKAVVLQSSSAEGAFLPPRNGMEMSIRQTYPSSLFTFIEQYTPIILMNGAHIMLHECGDIYGFDNALHMLNSIVKKYPDAGLIIAIAYVNNQGYMQQLYSTMSLLGIAEQVFVLQNQKELWPLFKHIDLFIRPTLSDGASISLEEACYFNVPCVASDVCERPAQVTLFKKGDVSDLIQAVECELGNLYANTSRGCGDSYTV